MAGGPQSDNRSSVRNANADNSIRAQDQERAREATCDYFQQKFADHPYVLELLSGGSCAKPTASPGVVETVLGKLK